MATDTQLLMSHWRDAVPDDRIAHLIRDVSRAFVRALSMRLERYEIPVGHWLFLRVLWENDGITQKELSDRVGVMEPTTFAAVRSLEAMGYVVRKQHLPNRKNVFVCLTPEGRALKRKLVPLAVAANEQAARGISQADMATTRKVLLAMLGNLTDEAYDEGGGARGTANGRRAAARPKAPANGAAKAAAKGRVANGGAGAARAKRARASGREA